MHIVALEFRRAYPPSPICACPILFQDTPKPYAALARRMALPQTAVLALAGPLEVPETGGGRAWLQAFDDDFELIQVGGDGERQTIGRRKLIWGMGVTYELRRISREGESRGGLMHLHPFLMTTGGATGPFLGILLRPLRLPPPPPLSPCRYPQPTPGEERRSRSLAATVTLLSDLVRRLIASGWGASRIHLFGFSQGGVGGFSQGRK